MLRVVHYIRATNISISTDLSFRMRLKSLKKSTGIAYNNSSKQFWILTKAILTKTILLEFYQVNKNLEL